VLTTVDLDDEPGGMRREIREISADRNLTPKMRVRHRFAQRQAEALLCRRLGAAELARTSDRRRPQMRRGAQPGHRIAIAAAGTERAAAKPAGEGRAALGFGRCGTV
jgi:hypothetical protein